MQGIEIHQVESTHPEDFSTSFLGHKIEVFAPINFGMKGRVLFNNSDFVVGFS